MAGRIGISTACFYPLETEKSLKKICDKNVESCEIFFNTSSELDEGYINGLSELLTDNGVYVTSLHPFASFAESYFLFSSYKRRFRDALEHYKRYFEAMNKLGAKVLVIHGGKYSLSISHEEYFERFGELSSLGKAFGLVTAQENVVHYLSESPEFMRLMNDALGDLFNMVLDIKQSFRAGFSPSEFISAVGNKIAHVHLSDHNAKRDCIPPLSGEFNFAHLFNDLDEINYKGDYTVELYSSSYADEDEIFISRDRLQMLFEKRLENTSG